jgi:hypothetical protein
MIRMEGRGLRTGYDDALDDALVVTPGIVQAT